MKYYLSLLFILISINQIKSYTRICDKQDQALYKEPEKALINHEYSKSSPENHIISCIECVAKFDRTIEITHGGLNNTNVVVKILQNCDLQIWSTEISAKGSENNPIVQISDPGNVPINNTVNGSLSDPDGTTIVPSSEITTETDSTESSNGLPNEVKNDTSSNFTVESRDDPTVSTIKPRPKTTDKSVSSIGVLHKYSWCYFVFVLVKIILL